MERKEKWQGNSLNSEFLSPRRWKKKHPFLTAQPTPIFFKLEEKFPTNPNFKHFRVKANLKKIEKKKGKNFKTKSRKLTKITTMPLWVFEGVTPSSPIFSKCASPQNSACIHPWINLLSCTSSTHQVHDVFMICHDSFWQLFRDAMMHFFMTMEVQATQ